MKEKDVKEKKILTANQMIGELLLSLALYGIMFFILYKIIYVLTYKYFIENQKYILLAFFIIVFQTLIVFAIFKLGNRKVFKKGNIYKKDVSKVMNNIAFVVIILLLIQVISIFANVETSIDTVREKNFSYQYREKILSYLYDEDEMAIYLVEKEKAIEEAKKQVYRYLIIVEIGICVVYISAIFLEKRYLYNKAI